MSDYVRKPLRDAQQWSRGEYSRNKPWKLQQGTKWNAAWNQGRRRSTESRWQNCVWKGISLKTEKNGKSNSRGIVKKCTLIRRKQKKHKKAELNMSRRKEFSNLQRTDAMQRSQQIWCCKQGPNRSTNPKTPSWAKCLESCPWKRFIQAAEQLRWHRWCQSGMHHVSWRRKRSL